MKSTLLIIFLLLPLCVAKAQNSGGRCIKHRTAPPANSYYWPPDTNVKVYFARTMFTAEQREALFAAIKTWSEVASESGTGVKFTYVGEIDAVVICTGCLKVTRRSVHSNDPKHYAFFYPLRLDNDGLLISARIDFDFATTSPQALQGFMAHELGHGMGLWDCPTCKKKRTIMNAFPGINRDNGLIGPSHCDAEVVKEIYQLRRRAVNNGASEISSRREQ